MKLFKKIVLVLIVVSITSCEKNSDSPKVDEVSIVGNWKLISDIEDGIEYVEEGDCDLFVIFTETTISVKEYYGNDCSLLVPVDSKPYSIENNILLNFYDEEENISVEIIEITESTLKLKEFDDGDYLSYTIWEKQ